MASKDTFRSICVAFNLALGVDLQAILKDVGRQREKVEMRYMAYYIFKSRCYCTGREMSEIFGRDRVSILLGAKTFGDWLKYDRRIQKTYSRVISKMDKRYIIDVTLPDGKEEHFEFSDREERDALKVAYLKKDFITLLTFNY